MRATTDEHRSRMIRRAKEMDGVGPPLHLLQAAFASTPRTWPKRREFSPNGIFFSDYGGLRSYLQRYDVGDADLMRYLNHTIRGNNPIGFEVPGSDGPRMVFIYMRGGRYGVADDPSLNRALHVLKEVTDYMQRD